MSGGGTTTQTEQTRDPWAPAVPYLNQIMSQGQSLYNSGTGSQTYGGPLVADQSQQTQMGINGLTNTANAQQATAGQPLAYGQNLIQNNGLTSGYDAPQNTYANVTAAAGQPTSSATNLAGMASGADAGQNPYLLKMLADNNARIGNQVNSSISGMGRYGSAGHTDVLARTLASTDNPVLSAAYENDRNRMLSASGQIDQSNNAARGLQLNAAQGQTNLLNAGQQNAAQWANMLPQLQQMSYAPSQQLLGAGGLQDAYNQKNIDAQRQLFEQQQAMPWNQLSRFSGAVSGLSGLTGNAGSMTGTSDTQKQLGLQDYMSMFAGGGNSAASGVANAGSSILGFLSDRTTKTDIEKLGKDPDTGLMMYAYRYKSDVEKHGRGIPKVVGPMAQDIEKAAHGSTERFGGKLVIKGEAAETLGIMGLVKKAA